MQQTVMTVKKKGVIAPLLVLSCLFFSSAFAQDSEKPIHIEADRMISLEEKNAVMFFGNVDAKQGKVTIHSQEMTIYYVPKDGKSKNNSSQVKRLICKKDVEVIQDDWLGTGERMDYFTKDRKVILSGNAKAWQGQNMVAGETITYYLDEKRSIVEHNQAKSGGRVTATLHPDSDKKN